MHPQHKYQGMSCYYRNNNVLDGVHSKQLCFELKTELLSELLLYKSNQHHLTNDLYVLVKL